MSKQQDKLLKQSTSSEFTSAEKTSIESIEYAIDSFLSQKRLNLGYDKSGRFFTQSVRRFGDFDKTSSKWFYDRLIVSRISYLETLSEITESNNGKVRITDKMIEKNGNANLLGVSSIQSFWKKDSHGAAAYGSIYFMSPKSRQLAKGILQGAQLPNKNDSKKQELIKRILDAKVEQLYGTFEKVRPGQGYLLAYGVSLASENNPEEVAKYRAIKQFEQFIGTKVFFVERRREREIDNENFEMKISTNHSQNYIFEIKDEEGLPEYFNEEYEDEEFHLIFRTETVKSSDNFMIEKNTVDIIKKSLPYTYKNIDSLKKYPTLRVLRTWQGRDPDRNEPVVGVVLIWEQS